MGLHYLWKWVNHGTGKTLTAIAIIGALYLDNRIRRVLIVAPLSILGVWRDEFRRYAAFPYSLAVLAGSSAKKTQAMAAMTGTDLQAIVVNYESAWRLEREIGAWKPDLILADEGHKMKTHSTRVSKAMHRLGTHAAYRLLLTGTLLVNRATDVFSPYKFLAPQLFGNNYWQFRNLFFDPSGYGGYQWTLKKHMEPTLLRLVHSIAFVAKKADCLDLPETTDEIRMVDLEPNAIRVYRDLVKDSIAALDKGEITVTNVLTRLLRLSQLTGGFLTDDEGDKPQQVSSAKLDALADILDSAIADGQKLVIIARFVPEIEAIRAMLTKRNVAYSLVKGGVTDRDEQVFRFQNDPDCMVFVGQIAVASLGLTLTAASVLAFFSLDYSMSNYEQCRARIHRVGQQNRCTYIHLLARGTVDETVLNALRGKADLARAMIDGYRSGSNPFNGTNLCQ